MKKLISFTISLIIITQLFIVTAFAQGATPQNTNTQATSMNFTCADVGTNAKGFFVIMEEPLGGPDAKYCYRVCKEITGIQPKRVCKIQDKCTTDDDIGTNYTCDRIQVLLAESGGNLINQYVRMIYLWSAGTIGIVAVLIIVISGIQIMFAGSAGDLAEPKKRIMQVLFGLVVLFLSGLILYTINPTFFV